MSYLEVNRIYHCDLCASNILLNGENVAKICDFGLARKYEDLKKVKIGKVRIRHTAPEVLIKKYFTSKSDVWSFGILLYELFSYGRMPYSNVKLNDVQEYVRSGKRMSAPENCPNHIYIAMCLCWNLKSKSRPKFRYFERFFSNLSKAL